MRQALLIILIIACSMSWAVVEDDGSCNYTWYSMRDGQCKCGSELRGRLRCNDYNKTVEITAGFCMTYDPMGRFKGSSLIVGGCPYGVLTSTTDRKYNRLPTDPTLVNTTQCSPYHRKGLFCGECIEGFGPAVYSFDLHCANCSHFSTATAITLYITLECVPITVFYLVLAIYQPKIMTGPQLGYIIFSQCIYNIVLYSKYIYFSLSLNIPEFLSVLGKIGIELAGVWNLKFFKFLTPPFCISEKLSGVHVHILGFITPLFPLFLVIITFIILEFISWYGCVHSRCYFMSKHIIHAFATCTILSIYLTLGQAYAILSTSYVLDTSDKIVGKVLNLDPDIHLFGVLHVPYLASTLILSFFLAAIPGVLLCIYPTRVYRRLSQCLHPRRQLAIKIFVETVNSGFKDGLNGTHDYRMIPGAIILFGIFYALFMSLQPYYGFDGFPSLIAGFIFILMAFTVSNIKPCKDLLTNMSLSFHLLLMGILIIFTVLWWQDLLLKSEVLASWIISLTLIPHVLMITWVLYKTVKMISNSHRCAGVCERFRCVVSGLYSMAKERMIALRQISAKDQALLETQPLLHQ